MLFKTLVVLLLAAVVSSLFSGLFFLMRDRGNSTRAVRSLTWRIGISLALFVLLLVGAAAGWIDPRGPV